MFFIEFKCAKTISIFPLKPAYTIEILINANVKAFENDIIFYAVIHSDAKS